MVERDLTNTGLLDCLSNIQNAIATLKAAAEGRDSDVIMSLKHAAEGLPYYAQAAQSKGPSDAQTEAFVRIGCLADLVDKVNLDFDDPLLHAASVLLHLANEQLVLEPA